MGMSFMVHPLTSMVFIPSPVTGCPSLVMGQKHECSPVTFTISMENLFGSSIRNQRQTQEKRNGSIGTDILNCYGRGVG